MHVKIAQDSLVTDQIMQGTYERRTKRPTWKNYSYDRLQAHNISDGQCTACNSGYARRKW